EITCARRNIKKRETLKRILRERRQNWEKSTYESRSAFGRKRSVDEKKTRNLQCGDNKHEAIREDRFESPFGVLRDCLYPEKGNRLSRLLLQ
ncbi:hypothetical protein CEXT_24731, partial [Caerostris extrusa]